MKVIFGDYAESISLIPENGQDNVWLNDLMKSKKTKERWIRLYARKIEQNTAREIPFQVSISIWNMSWTEIPNKLIK